MNQGNDDRSRLHTGGKISPRVDADRVPTILIPGEIRVPTETVREVGEAALRRIGGLSPRTDLAPPPGCGELGS